MEHPKPTQKIEQHSKKGDQLVETRARSFQKDFIGALRWRGHGRAGRGWPFARECWICHSFLSVSSFPLPFYFRLFSRGHKETSEVSSRQRANQSNLRLELPLRCPQSCRCATQLSRFCHPQLKIGQLGHKPASLSPNQRRRSPRGSRGLDLKQPQGRELIGTRGGLCATETSKYVFLLSRSTNQKIVDFLLSLGSEKGGPSVRFGC